MCSDDDYDEVDDEEFDGCSLPDNFCELNDLSPLFETVCGDDLDSVKKAVEKGADVNALAECRVSALHVAAGRDKVEFVQELIDLGAQVDVRNAYRETPLLTALELTRGEVVKLLVKAGANTRAVNRDQDGVLHYAAARSHQKQDLPFDLFAGARIDARNSRGQTPLQLACGFGHVELVEYLLARGAKLKTRDNRGRTPLHAAAEDGEPALIELLLSRGLNPKARDRHGATPLHLAAVGLNVKAMELLLKAGADTNTRDSKGRTPLARALEVFEPLAEPNSCDWGGPDIEMRQLYAAIRLLLNRGANPNVRSRNRLTPLHLAAAGGSPFLVSLLIEHGAKPNVTDRWKRTPLHLAVRRSDVESLELLLEAGADPRRRDQKNRTALKMASASGRGDLIQLLETGSLTQSGEGASRPSSTKIAKGSDWGSATP